MNNQYLPPGSLGKITKNALTAKDTGAVPVADKTVPAGIDLNDVTEPLLVMAGDCRPNIASVQPWRIQSSC